MAESRFHRDFKIGADGEPHEVEESDNAAMVGLEKDDPIMIAWHKFCKMDDFKDALRWATATKYDDGRPINPIQQEQHAKGAMWLAFTAKWERIADLEHELSKERQTKAHRLTVAEDRIAELDSQVDALLADCQAHGTYINSLESKLKERDAYIQLLATGNAERIGKLEAQLAEAKLPQSEVASKETYAYQLRVLEQRLARAREVLTKIAERTSGDNPPAWDAETVAQEALRDLEAQ